MRKQKGNSMQTQSSTGTVNITFCNLTLAAVGALKDAIETFEQNQNAEKVYNESQTKTTRGRKGPQLTTTDEVDEEESEEDEKPTKRKAAKEKAANKKAAKASEDESEEETESAEEVEEEESEDDESEEVSDEDSEDEDDEEESSVSFADVKKAIDKYGEAKPKAMRALLASFNLKNTAELKAAKSKHEAVYRKILATFKK